MSVHLATENKASLESVESILNELIDISNEVSHIQSELGARAIALSTANTLVELARSGPTPEHTSQLEIAVRISEGKLGAGGISIRSLETQIGKLVTLEDDLSYVRKIARGNGLQPQAINMLMQIVRQNPGDRGQLVLSSMMSYAQLCGITFDLPQLSPKTNACQTTSVLPDIVIPDDSSGYLSQYRDVALQVTLGVFVAATALLILT